jgi:hypothetical protein
MNAKLKNTVESEADELFSMVNLSPRLTGLPMTVWASPRGQARHAARIKVNLAHGRRMTIHDAVVVTIRPSPQDLSGQLPPADLQAVSAWIRLNEDALVDYWEFRLDTDELLQRLQRLP